jgi:hypothetical protein
MMTIPMLMLKITITTCTTIVVQVAIVIQRRKLKRLYGYFRMSSRIKGGRFNEYPIQCLLCLHCEDRRWHCNIKAVSFITLLDRLAIELGLFEEHYRGGLSCQDIYSDKDDDALENPMRCDNPTLLGREYNQHVDGKYLHFLIQLRKMGILK